MTLEAAATVKQPTLADYAAVVGEQAIRQLERLAEPFRGKKFVHVNSTRVGGGVAEILDKMVPLMRELGIDATWEVITGTPDFFQCTKSFHNALQGDPVDIPERLLREYEEVNRRNAAELKDKLADADFVLIHDPQPAPLLKFIGNRKGTWIWRCHIDASRPQRQVWRYVRQWVEAYDASIFSLAAFTQALPHPQYVIPVSIDPLGEKNRALSPEEVASVYPRFGLDPERPLILQVSRYDRFKDPVGVIKAYRMARRYVPGLQLVLVGGGATDDPEGEAVLAEVREAASDDPDVHVLVLPPDSHVTINALQRAADVVLQKSTKEGFGLTVSEAMWKRKPVIGGNVGGIRLQVIDYETGFLVNSPEGAALRIRWLLENPERRAKMGERAREHVRENFLLTRHLREYLTAFLGVHYGNKPRIELG
ncbi:MAG: glycosyl transferase family 1 [Firmicutes bacterium ZCTH02-B6]|nr:MAG: glycosyl transferase family 1 [Firmicutes bacterium ZCTH02-B6]